MFRSNRGHDLGLRKETEVSWDYICGVNTAHTRHAMCLGMRAVEGRSLQHSAARGVLLYFAGQWGENQLWVWPLLWNQAAAAHMGTTWTQDLPPSSNGACGDEERIPIRTYSWIPYQPAVRNLGRDHGTEGKSTERKWRARTRPAFSAVILGQLVYLLLFFFFFPYLHSESNSSDQLHKFIMNLEWENVDKAWEQNHLTPSS